jgi:hypothetical protein
MGIPTLIGSAHTASGAASIDITSGIDSTYDEYMFVCTDMNAGTDATRLGFQVNAASGSGFDENMTSTCFRTYHNESGTDSSDLGYSASLDQSGTDAALQVICSDCGNGADECAAGTLHLFTPSNTTYVTHWYARFVTNRYDDHVGEFYTAGYINTTAAIDEIQFKMNDGSNFDGVIQMYGIA